MRALTSGAPWPRPLHVLVYLAALLTHGSAVKSAHELWPDSSSVTSLSGDDATPSLTFPLKAFKLPSPKAPRKLIEHGSGGSVVSEPSEKERVVTFHVPTDTGLSTVTGLVEHVFSSSTPTRSATRLQGVVQDASLPFPSHLEAHFSIYQEEGRNLVAGHVWAGDDTYTIETVADDVTVTRKLQADVFCTLHGHQSGKEEDEPPRELLGVKEEHQLEQAGGVVSEAVHEPHGHHGHRHHRERGIMHRLKEVVGKRQAQTATFEGPEPQRYLIYISTRRAGTYRFPFWGEVSYTPCQGLAQTTIDAAVDEVEEDFAPFDVTVTTNKTLYDDWSTYRVEALIGSFNSTRLSSVRFTTLPVCGYGFIASYKFLDNMVAINCGSCLEALATAISHEVGHTFGLTHDADLSEVPGSLQYQYLNGLPPGNPGGWPNDRRWNSIMGASLPLGLTQWTGPDGYFNYPFASNRQDDVDIISLVTGPRPGTACDLELPVVTMSTPATANSPVATLNLTVFDVTVIGGGGSITALFDETAITCPGGVHTYYFFVNPGDNVEAVITTRARPNLRYSAELQRVVSGPNGWVPWDNQQPESTRNNPYDARTNPRTLQSTSPPTPVGSAATGTVFRLRITSIPQVGTVTSLTPPGTAVGESNAQNGYGFLPYGSLGFYTVEFTATRTDLSDSTATLGPTPVRGPTRVATRGPTLAPTPRKADCDTAETLRVGDNTVGVNRVRPVDNYVQFDVTDEGRVAVPATCSRTDTVLLNTNWFKFRPTEFKDLGYVFSLCDTPQRLIDGVLASQTYAMYVYEGCPSVLPGSTGVLRGCGSADNCPSTANAATDPVLMRPDTDYYILISPVGGRNRTVQTWFPELIITVRGFNNAFSATLCDANSFFDLTLGNNGAVPINQTGTAILRPTSADDVNSTSRCPLYTYDVNVLSFVATETNSYVFTTRDTVRGSATPLNALVQVQGPGVSACSPSVFVLCESRGCNGLPETPSIRIDNGSRVSIYVGSSVIGNPLPALNFTVVQVGTPPPLTLPTVLRTPAPTAAPTAGPTPAPTAPPPPPAPIRPAVTCTNGGADPGSAVGTCGSPECPSSPLAFTSGSTGCSCPANQFAQADKDGTCDVCPPGFDLPAGPAPDNCQPSTALLASSGGATCPDIPATRFFVSTSAQLQAALAAIEASALGSVAIVWLLKGGTYQLDRQYTVDNTKDVCMQGFAGRDKVILQSAAGFRHLQVATDGQLRTIGLTFKGNRASNAVGGGVVIEQASAIFIETRFTENRVDGGRYRGGGFHANNGGGVVLRGNLLFDNNLGQTGGAFMVERGPGGSTVDQEPASTITFRNNEATGSGNDPNGGGDPNYFGSGGAVHNSRSSVRFNGIANFENNVAARFGGGLYMYQHVGLNLYRSGTLKGNSAGVNGGGVSQSGAIYQYFVAVTFDAVTVNLPNDIFVLNDGVSVPQILCNGLPDPGTAASVCGAGCLTQGFTQPGPICRCFGIQFPWLDGSCRDCPSGFDLPVVGTAPQDCTPTTFAGPDVCALLGVTNAYFVRTSADLNAAMAALEASGLGVVARVFLLDAGTYQLTRSYTLSNGVKVCMEGLAGRDKTIIQSATGQRHLLIDFITTVCTFKQLTFQGNRGSNAVGGGVVIGLGGQGEGKFQDVRFTANRVDPNDRYGGGGLHVYQARVEMRGDMLFDNNLGMTGGGFCAESAVDVVVPDGTVTFRNNAAFGSGPDPVHGGDRGSGGGLYSINSRVPLLIINFENNVAAAFGGGMYIQGGGFPVVGINSGLFEGNSAGTNGGAGYLFGGALAVGGDVRFSPDTPNTPNDVYAEADGALSSSIRCLTPGTTVPGSMAGTCDPSCPSSPLAFTDFDAGCRCNGGLFPQTDATCGSCPPGMALLAGGTGPLDCLPTFSPDLTQIQSRSCYTPGPPLAQVFFVRTSAQLRAALAAVETAPTGNRVIWLLDAHTYQLDRTYTISGDIGFCMSSIPGRNEAIIQSAPGQRHLLITASAVGITRVTFQGNRGSSIAGGGVIVRGPLDVPYNNATPSCSFIETRFSANRADANRFGGGGLHAYNVRVRLGGDLLFDGNQGQTGGGMCVEQSIVAFLTDTDTLVTFRDNLATGTGTEINGGDLGSGGGLYSILSVLFLQNDRTGTYAFTFQNNVAAAYGGGLYTYGTARAVIAQTADIALPSTAFIGNAAGTNGGAIYNIGSTLSSQTNVTFDPVARNSPNDIYNIFLVVGGAPTVGQPSLTATIIGVPSTANESTTDVPLFNTGFDFIGNAITPSCSIPSSRIVDNNIAFIDVPTVRGNETVIGVNYTINVCSPTNGTVDGLVLSFPQIPVAVGNGSACIFPTSCSPGTTIFLPAGRQQVLVGRVATATLTCTLTIGLRIANVITTREGNGTIGGGAGAGGAGGVGSGSGSGGAWSTAPNAFANATDSAIESEIRTMSGGRTSLNELIKGGGPAGNEAFGGDQQPKGFLFGNPLADKIAKHMNADEDAEAATAGWSSSDDPEVEAATKKPTSTSTNKEAKPSGIAATGDGEPEPPALQTPTTRSGASGGGGYGGRVFWLQAGILAALLVASFRR